MLLLCALALVACDDDTTATADLAMPDLATPLATCTATCAPACTTGTTCVSSNNATFPFAATCLSACTTDADCGTRACVDFPGATPAGRWCIAADEPTACGTHCDLAEPVSHCDGNELVTFYLGVVCGVRHHVCASGCVEDNPDGGVDRQARCL